MNSEEHGRDRVRVYHDGTGKTTMGEIRESIEDWKKDSGTARLWFDKKELTNNTDTLLSVGINNGKIIQMEWESASIRDGRRGPRSVL